MFEVRAALSRDAPRNVLGLWTVTPVVSGVSFAAGAPTGRSPSETHPPAVWRANLAANKQAAAAELADAQAQLDTTARNLEVAAGRLDSFIAQQARGAVYALPGEPADSPEAELRSLVDDLRSRQVLAYGLPTLDGVDWDDALKKFEGFLDQLRELLNDPLMVETAFEDVEAARTAVRWMGGTYSAFDAQVDAELLARHRETLALALRSRTTLLRLSALAAEGAARLAVILAMPTSGILMLPAVFKYLTRVMEELKVTG